MRTKVQRPAPARYAIPTTATRAMPPTMSRVASSQKRLNSRRTACGIELVRTTMHRLNSAPISIVSGDHSNHQLATSRPASAITVANSALPTSSRKPNLISDLKSSARSCSRLSAPYLISAGQHSRRARSTMAT